MERSELRNRAQRYFDLEQKRRKILNEAASLPDSLATLAYAIINSSIRIPFTPIGLVTELGRKKNEESKELSKLALLVEETHPLFNIHFKETKKPFGPNNKYQGLLYIAFMYYINNGYNQNDPSYINDLLTPTFVTPAIGISVRDVPDYQVDVTRVEGSLQYQLIIPPRKKSLSVYRKGDSLRTRRMSPKKTVYYIEVPTGSEKGEEHLCLDTTTNGPLRNMILNRKK